MADERQSSLTKLAGIAAGTAGPSILAGWAVPDGGVVFPQAAFIVMAALIGLLFSAITVLYQQNLETERRHREYLERLLDQAVGVGEETVQVARSVVDLHRASGPARRKRDQP